MKHLDLFSGIGGFALAASWVWGDEHEIHSFVEIDPFCQKVLNKHWPDVPVISDIRELKNERFVADTGLQRQAKHEKQTAGVEQRSKNAGKATGERIDLLTGGFPCQPFSVAGKQRSQEDDRYLWPEMFRVIQEFRPTWIIGENVAGIINLALDQVLSDLESASYEVQSFLIPACGVDAPHRRDRVWIVAHTRCSNGQTRDGYGMGNEKSETKLQITLPSRKKPVADSKRILLQGCNNGQEQGQFGRKSGWPPEPNVCRVANGVPNRVHRLRALGNAIVPQTVVPIMQAIKNLGI